MRIQLTIVLLMLVFIAKGQETAKAIISDYIERMGKIGLPEEGKTYYLEMRVKNLYHGDSSGPSDFYTKVYLTKSQMRYSSDYISVFQDTVDALVLLHANKQIYWTKGAQISDAMERSSQLTDFQLEVITAGEIDVVTEGEIDGQKFKIINLSPSPEVAEKLGVEKLVFNYSLKEKRVERIKIHYQPTQQLKSQEFIYTTFDLDYKEAGDEIPVKSYIFDSSGNLRKKYEGYRLIDNRA